MSDTSLRYLAMLEMIPRAPRKEDAKTLQQKLQNKGYEIDIRSIQRDLVALSRIYPIRSDGAKPQGWCWMANAAPIELPALDPHAALMFKLVESHIRQLLPASTLEYLQPWFQSANGVLEQNGNGLAHWPEKIRVLPRGIPQQSPHIPPEVSTAVYQALLQDKQLEILYARNNGQPEPQSHTLHPLALVVRDRVIYLIGAYEGNSAIYQFALHRMVSAQVSEALARRPADFSLDAYIAQGGFGIPYTQQPIQLEAEFLRHVAIHLRESPIADDQVIEDVDEDNVLLHATVADTLELRIWLRSFGDEVEVLKPESLRHEFCALAGNLYGYYF